VPGLVLAEHWQVASFLVEGKPSRCEFLESVRQAAGAPVNLRVCAGRAEELAREVEFESVANLVTARSFGPPAVVAECAARFLAHGGILLVSEPPEASNGARRWPETLPEELGLTPLGPYREEFSIFALERTGPIADRVPRRVGIPAKRPLF
jgi:16S rRNA (guanine527-N7)-methyltransferase